MKLVVTALLESMKAIFNVLIVIFMVWYYIYFYHFLIIFLRVMFAILAANIVGGKLGYCGVPEDQSYYNINKITVKLFIYI